MISLFGITGNWSGHFLPWCVVSIGHKIEGKPNELLLTQETVTGIDVVVLHGSITTNFRLVIATNAINVIVFCCSIDANELIETKTELAGKLFLVVMLATEVRTRISTVFDQQDGAKEEGDKESLHRFSFIHYAAIEGRENTNADERFKQSVTERE